MKHKIDNISTLIIVLELKKIPNREGRVFFVTAYIYFAKLADVWKTPRSGRHFANISAQCKAQAAQALVVRSYFFKKIFYMRTFSSWRDIVTAVIYCYITTLRET